MKRRLTIEDQLAQWQHGREQLAKNISEAPQFFDELESKLVPPEGSPADQSLDSLLHTAILECSQAISLAALANDSVQSAMRSLNLYLTFRMKTDNLSAAELAAVAARASAEGISLRVPEYARERIEGEPTDDDLISIADVEQMTKLHRATITKYVKLGRFPKPVSPPNERRRWRFGDIRRHVECQRRRKREPAGRRDWEPLRAAAGEARRPPRGGLRAFRVMVGGEGRSDRRAMAQ